MGNKPSSSDSIACHVRAPVCYSGTHADGHAHAGAVARTFILGSLPATPTY